MKYLFVCILLVTQVSASGQTRIEKKGTVSYKSTQNIYVKFENTGGIAEGDTLFVKQNDLFHPMVKVKFISSTSAAGEPVNNISLKINDTLIAFVPAPINIATELIVTRQDTSYLSGVDTLTEISRKPLITSPNRYSGKLSVQSVSSFNNSDFSSEVQRWRYSFSFRAENISNSGLSFTNYMIFNYRTNDWQNVKTNLFNALKNL